MNFKKGINLKKSAATMNTNTGESSALPLSTEGSRRALLQSLAVAGGAAVGALLPMDTVLARHTGVPHNSPETLLCVETRRQTH